MSHITSTERFAKAGPYTYTYPMKNTLIGYARCSTDKQDLSAQGQALFNLGVSEDNIYTDHGLTGTNRDRPGLDQAIAAVREGEPGRPGCSRRHCVANRMQGNRLSARRHRSQPGLRRSRPAHGPVDVKAAQTSRGNRVSDRAHNL